MAAVQECLKLLLSPLQTEFPRVVMHVLSVSAQKEKLSREEHPDSEVEDDPADFGSGK